MNRSILIFVILAGTIGYGYVQDHPEILQGGGSTLMIEENNDAEGQRPDGREDIITTQDGNQEMDAAYARTAETLDKFVTSYRESGASPDRYTVKVAFPVTDQAGNEGDEVIWVSAFEDLGGTNFAGILANEPEWMEGYRLGDRVEFTGDMVRDWALEDGGRYYGHFTTRVLMSYMNPDELEMLNGILHEVAIPPYFQD